MKLQMTLIRINDPCLNRTFLIHSSNMEKVTTKTNKRIDQMFSVGAHFGYARSRRHPTVAPYIFGVKNRVEIIDLEKTDELLTKTLEFIRKIASENGQILFVSSKPEAREAIRRTAGALGMPFVAGRWIGGTFTNFGQIRKRIERFETLTSQKEKGELGKYTKKERLLIDREIAKLDRFFSGLITMKAMPKAMLVVDSDKEEIAVAEARASRIPVIALSGSDCNLSVVDHAIVANDSAMASISYFLERVVEAYKEATAKPRA